MDAAPGTEPSEEGTKAEHERAQRPPRMGEPGWLPDHLEEWRVDFRRTSPGERVRQGIELSRFATRVAVAGRKA